MNSCRRMYHIWRRRKQDISAIDIYAFGALIQWELSIVQSIRFIEKSVKWLSRKSHAWRSAIKIKMVNVTANTITSVRFVLSFEWKLISIVFKIDYIKTTELVDRVPIVHESDLPNAVKFVFDFAHSFHHSFLFSSDRYPHISMVLMGNIWMNYWFVVVSLFINSFETHSKNKNSKRWKSFEFVNFYREISSWFSWIDILAMLRVSERLS